MAERIKSVSSPHNHLDKTFYMSYGLENCLWNSCSMACPSVHGDTPLALGSGLSYITWYNYFIPSA